MNKLLVCLILILSGFLSYLYLTNFIYPNTYIANIKISGLTTVKAQKVAKEFVNRPIKLRVRERIYQTTYQNLGILIDEKTLQRDIAKLNNQKIYWNILHFFQSFNNDTVIIPPVTFTEDFYRFTNYTVFDFNTIKQPITLDEANKRFVYNQTDGSYKIDGENLRAQILLNFGEQIALEPELIAVTNPLETKVLTYNSQLDHIFDDPVNIVLQDGTNAKNVTITSDDMREIVQINYHEDSENIDLLLDNAAFSTVVEPQLSKENNNPDKKISLANLTYDMNSLIQSRVLGARSDTVVAKVDYAPNTDGTKAQKYIEVDISQQRMFLFKDGQLYATHRVSSGLYYPTPKGEFKVLNKATNAYSDIYNVWMPYWMAFYHDPKVNAFIGIHELPYWVTSDGQKMQRPREFIGTPKTGGCVALDIGVAKAVYEFSDIGTPVYVFE